MQRCSVHLLCTNRRLIFSHKDALTHLFWQSGKSHAYSSSSSYFTCHSQFISEQCAHTHTHTEWTTKAANEQECPQISETARQLSQQGVFLLVGCCSQPTVPPNQTMARLAFPATGVLILYSERWKKRTTGRKELGGDGWRAEGDRVTSAATR